ncbi:MAG: beta-lactamase family protein [Chitinophagaceae bacterium]|nr:beta-lactamase family protein [Chitinophagaceae bacterium]
MPAHHHKQIKKPKDKIRQVENSLSPVVVYGDSLPNYNLEQRMREKGVKGLSIAVIKDYSIEWAKGYGWADSAEGRKVTTETRFQAASISKSLNSLAVMKLIQEGKLDPEVDINNYLTSWKFPYDSVSKGKKINTWNLLSHTAGLNLHGFPGYDVTDSLPTLVQLLNGEKPANTEAIRSVFEPGKEFSYSGGGTTISQLMLQDITGKSYADYVEENVLKPIGMRNSSFRQPPVDKADYATGYYTNGSPVKGKFHVYPELAAAGLWTTPTDLAQYIIECQLTLKGESQKVLSQEMMQRRMTPYLDSIFALGVFIESKPVGKFFIHTGGNEAFVCIAVGSLEGGNGVVIMLNGEDFSIITELLHSVSRVYGWTDYYKPEVVAAADRH